MRTVLESGNTSPPLASFLSHVSVPPLSRSDQPRRQPRTSLRRGVEVGDFAGVKTEVPKQKYSMKPVSTWSITHADRMTSQ